MNAMASPVLTPEQFPVRPWRGEVVTRDVDGAADLAHVDSVPAGPSAPTCPDLEEVDVLDLSRNCPRPDVTCQCRRTR